jgi:hypothetical protein
MRDGAPVKRDCTLNGQKRRKTTGIREVPAATIAAKDIYPCTSLNQQAEDRRSQRAPNA